MIKDERRNGLLIDDGEEYLEDDIEVENSTSPMIEPWRIDGACVDLCNQIALLAAQLSELVNRLRSLYV